VLPVALVLPPVLGFVGGVCGGAGERHSASRAPSLLSL
jgi:hypothetical protein